MHPCNAVGDGACRLVMDGRVGQVSDVPLNGSPSHLPITPSPSRPSDTSCMRQPQPEISASLSLSLVDHYQNGRTTPSNQLENQPSYLWPYSIILPPSSLAPVWFYTVQRRQEEFPLGYDICLLSIMSVRRLGPNECTRG